MEQELAKTEEWPLSPNWWLGVRSVRGEGAFKAFDFIKITAQGPNEYERPITSIMVPKIDGLVCESHSFPAHLIHQNIHALQSELSAARAEFKNFHRMICETVGYYHDETDWRRDQASLDEHIRKQRDALQKAFLQVVGALEQILEWSREGDGSGYALSITEAAKWTLAKHAELIRKLRGGE